MLQPREFRVTRMMLQKNWSTTKICQLQLFAVICWLSLVPLGKSEFLDEQYNVEPTPALRLEKGDLTTVLLVNKKNDYSNEYHGRFLNLRPEVGLLTSTARTFIQEGVTTEYATQVLGTTLNNGRIYAQYLKKSSRILFERDQLTPSVVTSWVGDSISSVVLQTKPLLQSHNDLVNAEKPDWQDIDDRLLLERNVFIGNTDFVGLNDNNGKTIATSSQQSMHFLSASYFPSSTSSLKVVPVNIFHRSGQKDDVDKKLPPNKVLSIGDLQTYTIKNQFAPSGFSSDNIATKMDHILDSKQNFEHLNDIVNRTPKQYYRQIMNSQNSLTSTNTASARTVANRSLSTITYYGFADFTTTVGDSVIVFSPSTSTSTTHLGHVTSIKGEATLSGISIHIPQIDISITTNLIQPSLVIEPTQILMPAEIFLNNNLKDESKLNKQNDSIATSKLDTAIETKRDHDDINLLLDSSEMLFSEVTDSNRASVGVTTMASPILLSVPSNKEILEIYSSISNAEKTRKSSILEEPTFPSTDNYEDSGINTTTEEYIQTTTEESAKDKNQVPSHKQANLKILGGATTIFFEDDPFTNFVDPTGTYVTTHKPTVLTQKYEESDKFSNSIETTTDFSLENINEATTLNTSTVEEDITDIPPYEDTTDEPTTVLQTETNSSVSDLVEGINNNKNMLDESCKLTSQVFLTQVPKTLTSFTTLLVTDSILTDEIHSSTVTNIIPTFDITETTKQYCIHTTKIEEKAKTDQVQLEKSTIDETNNNEKDYNVKTTKTAFSNPYEKEENEEESNENKEGEPVEELEQTTPYKETDYEEDDSFVSSEDDNSTDEEIDIVYKTLYTTYTYLTTFFHDDTTSISSHTEVVTNIISSTLDSNNELTKLYSNDDIIISPTMALNPNTVSSKFVVPTELENIIREGEHGSDDTFSTTQPDENKFIKTYYTTYTYYTTIFAEGETDIMSRTEVHTNFITNTATPNKLSMDISSNKTVSSREIEESTIKKLNTDPKINTFLDKSVDSNNGAAPKLDYSTMIRSSMSGIPDLDDFSSITLVTDVRSSSSNGEQQIINNPLMKHNEPIDDQISSESNTDEIIPSATLLLQTSFTTFTYYTTMYSSDNTNVVSRLETVTNVVTETLQPKKTINLEEATLPITYFTTFTYWTKLAKNGEVTTLSREETISNVVTPTSMLLIPTSTDGALFHTSLFDIKTSTVQDIELSTLVNSIETERSLINPVSSYNSSVLVTSILEPTTYYTTYTYYTTSYETDKTITDSRFETVTNVITPEVTLTTVIIPTNVSVVSSSSTDNLPAGTNIILYDERKIIDSDGVSTLFYTTEILPTLEDGTSTEFVRSSSSLYVDENKKALLSTTIVPSVNEEGSTIRQYKTGLVRLIVGTRIGNHTTTLYESKVIGTFIENRYAQIIESTSSFLFEKTKTLIESTLISPSAVNNALEVTQQIDLTQRDPSANLESVQGSINENLNEEVDDHTEQFDDENYDAEGDYIKPRFPFQTKKRTFTPVIRPFASRNRPQFAPKKKNIAPSSATIITRSDFTPTITATPALKSSGRFSTLKKNGIPSFNNTVGNGVAASSRRFSRPSKPPLGSSQLFGASGIGSSSTFGSGRNRASSSLRIAPISTSKRSGSLLRPSSSSGFRPGLSSAYLGNSRLRIKPTATSLGLHPNGSETVTTLTQEISAEEQNTTEEQIADEEDDNTTENSRRNQNPLLRFRRPVNRPTAFSSTSVQRSNNSNSSVSQRRNPLSSRAKVTTTTTTTTTSRPRPRSFQRPTIVNLQSRTRPQNNLFPPRGLFQGQKSTANQEEKENNNKKNVSVNVNDSEDESEYDDEDDEEGEEDGEDDTNRRRRSNNKEVALNFDKKDDRNKNTENKNISKIITKRFPRVKREADTSVQTRSNFRNRFRRPKIINVAVEDRSTDEEHESELTSTHATTRSRVSSRYNGRYQNHHTSTTAATTPNNRAIRPTRPTSARSQFTLREKDTSSTTQKILTRSGTSFRRPQTAASSRRSTGSSTGNRRLKSFNNNNSALDSSARSTGTRSRNNNLGNNSRNRGSSVRSRTRNDYNADPMALPFDGTITVTHIIPAEVTIPIVNGKITEYKNVVTAKTSTEVLSPQQYTTFVGSNGQTMLALTRQESSINFGGATEITQFVLHDSPTTKVTFTPTTIRGRKTSFSHIIPSTIYSVENVVSTIRPQISANAPLANILLSQLLLGNIGLPANPLLGALGGGITQPTQLAAAINGPPSPVLPVTEYRTHTSTYVTTIYEGMSTILPVTFQGKKILTTIFDTTAQTITATEFVTDTIVITPTQQPGQVAQVNSLLLQQLLLQQQIQPQVDQSVLPILQSTPTNLLFSDNLQDLDTNNIRHINDNDDIDGIPMVEETQSHKTGRKKPRKSGKNHKRKQQLTEVVNDSSVITLYVSGRRPGEFSTILSTVPTHYDSSLHKRQALSDVKITNTIENPIDFYDADGSNMVNKYLRPLNFQQEIFVTPSHIASDFNNPMHINTLENKEQTQTLESIVGDVDLWYAKSSSDYKDQQVIRTNIVTYNEISSIGSELTLNQNIDTSLHFLV